MTKSVHLTDRAMLDLDEIELYSVKNWGKRVANKYLSDLGAAIERIAQAPDLLANAPTHPCACASTPRESTCWSATSLATASSFSRCAQP